MSAERPSKDEIFNAAAELVDAAERQAYLNEVCADDPQLREEIEDLLSRDLEAGSFLESPPPGLSPTIDQPLTEKPGTQIGPYKLLQQIGEGGMGVVYMAEQKEPVKRRVALKIIKPGMDTRQVIARFEAERQALAMMDHPNIAKVLDAGQTDSGRPYFVMELVNGLPVTKYCDEQHLMPKERLELFVPICQAVQHAHQKGIIHRDLKPSNILVALYDGQAVPKIIDFGVAKATSQTLTEKTMFTQLGQVLGTLEYMSPEQAERNQLDIDTRSDIYSLGVVLYELLTGETPFDRERLRSAAFDEMLRIIREEEPSKPSTKVSSSQSLPSIAANRRIEPARLGSTIRGELDWIVMKALEKDRGRRYETASKFAEDVQHYLNDEAVVACPPSAAYRFHKFARRNKGFLTAASVVSLLLLVAAAGSTVAAMKFAKLADEKATLAGDLKGALDDAKSNLVLARQQERQAKQNLERANAEQRRAEGNLDLALAALDAVYLDAIGEEKLLGKMAPKPGNSGSEIRTREPLTDLERQLLQRGLKFYEQFAKQNAASPRALVQTAQAYYRVGLLQTALGDTKSAEATYQAAIERFTALVQEYPTNVSHHRCLAEAHNAFSRICAEWPTAKEAIQAAINACSKAIELDRTNASHFIARAWFYNRLSMFDESLKDVEEACRLDGANLNILKDAAFLYGASDTHNDPDRVRTLLRQAIRLASDDAHLHLRLAESERVPGNLKESLPHYDRAIELDPDNVYALYWRAAVRNSVGEMEAARSDVTKADSLAGESPEFSYVRARCHQILGDYEESVKAFAIAEKHDPTNHRVFHHRGGLHLTYGQYQKAIEDFNKQLTIFPTSWATFKRRGSAYFHLGNWGQALADLQRALELNPKDSSTLIWIPPSLVARCPDESFREGLLKLADSAVEKNPGARGRRSQLCLGLGEWDKARAYLEEQLTSDTPGHYDYYQYALVCLAQNDLPKYRELCARMVQQYSQTDDASVANFAAWTCALGQDAVDDYEPPIGLATNAVEAQPESDQFLTTLGAILYRAGRHDEAIQRLTEVDTRLANPDRSAQSSPAYTWYFLALAHKQAGNDGQAEEYFNKATKTTDEVLDDKEHPARWNRKLTLELLRDEANRVIRDQSK